MITGVYILWKDNSHEDIYTKIIHIYGYRTSCNICNAYCNTIVTLLVWISLYSYWSLCSFFFVPGERGRGPRDGAAGVWDLWEGQYKYCKEWITLAIKQQQIRYNKHVQGSQTKTYRPAERSPTAVLDPGDRKSFIRPFCGTPAAHSIEFWAGPASKEPRVWTLQY